jgi:hypothetical protein
VGWRQAKVKKTDFIPVGAGGGGGAGFNPGLKQDFFLGKGNFNQKVK